MMNSVTEITPYSETDSLLKLLVIIIIMTSRQVFMQMNDAAVSLTVLVMNSWSMDMLLTREHIIILF